ncbi:hypothetical protein [Methylobacterium sp. E-046]|uniref:hypothetical protein n=1 Tax=Methylobacterium sp. E-046 TaxID=2836576 RepID=UPI001FBA5B7B|nr:hypothetical protein [Methylobacterium sp. E-046]MCJ2098929.1 hypothetical protein [Methylobacterium sp. E-046]
MSVNYSTAVAQGRLQAVKDLTSGKTLAAATGTATAGSLVIGTSALSGATGVLVTIPLASTTGTISGKAMSLDGTPLSAAAAAGGTPALAEIRNNAGTVIASGLTVGTSGTDIVLSSSPIVAGQTVSVTSGTITHP